MTNEHNENCQCGGKYNHTDKALEAKLDVGAEEFSEQIYDENAPIPPEFDEPHRVSSTGGELTS